MKKVETQFYTFGKTRKDRLTLKSGVSFGPVTVAYETYGRLSPARDNAILLFHALSGSQHAAGINKSVPGVGRLWQEECHVGWWNDYIGPGRALDTSQFFIICANYFGGCYGSTGPSSINPRTGRPYGARFPRIEANDMVDVQVRLLRHLGIERLHAAIGSSMGGMLAVNLAVRYPHLVANVVPIAAGLEVSTLQRIHNFEQVYAIESDPHYNRGDYYDGPGPVDGLALARMISHKTFVSLAALTSRARTEVVDRNARFKTYPLHYPVESYLLHQCQKFVKRFDANTYMLIIDVWQCYDLLKDTGAEDYKTLFAPCRHQKYLVFTIDSDVCFYPDQQEFMARTLTRCRVDCQRVTVHSDKGHDAFLLEPKLFTPHIDYALRRG